MPGIRRRFALRRSSGGADPRIPLETNSDRRRVRPAGHLDFATAVRRGQLYVGTRRRGVAGAQPRTGRRGLPVGSAAHRRARDVRGTGHLAAAVAGRHSDLVAGANAAGRLGSSHRPGATPAPLSHPQRGRPPDRDPRHLCAGGWLGQVVVGIRHGDPARLGAATWRRGGPRRPAAGAARPQQ